MAVTIVVGAIILWIVPILIVSSIGPKGRGDAGRRGYKSRFRVVPAKFRG